MTDYPGSAAAVVAAAIFFFFFVLIFAVAFYVISAWFLMKIFDKAGVQGRWRAWVPVYNTMILAKLGDVSPWVALGAAIVAGVLGQIPYIGWLFSLASLAATVMYSWRVGLKLGKEWYLLLLWLIPGVGTLVWLGILAFDQSRWNTGIAPAPWAANSFLSDRTVWQGVPVQTPAGGYAAQPGAPAPGTYAPPQGYQPPAAPPQGYQPPPAPPQGYQPPAPPPVSPQPPVAPQPPVTPEPPAAGEPDIDLGDGTPRQ